ncbi:MAG: substrate-binding domain-containing protein [Actinomycetota bacterium]|jgi:ribose transport system substrate-binding protein|nr:substrate-binding domain-containing protein [Actinomycetota bacterium]
MKKPSLRPRVAALAAAVALAVSWSMPSAASAAPKHFTIAYELGYVANNWQTEAEDLTLAASRVEPYKSLVTLAVHIAGQNTETQISEVNQEVASHVNAIILYPLSPTALAPAVKAACAAGVKVFTYDAHVDASCAYQSSIPYTPNLSDAWGAVAARWLAKDLHGHGNVVMLTGVAGVSQDTWNIESARKAFKQFPGIKVVAQVPALWNQAISKTKMSQLLSSHSNINGIWDENGCYGAEEAVLAAHDKPIPCAGNSSNGHRVMMLPKSEGGIGLPSLSLGTGVNGGALSLVDAVKVLEGHSVPHFVPNPVASQEVTNATVKLGANVVANKEVGPGFMWFGRLAQIPAAAQTVHAALTGKPGNG